MTTNISRNMTIRLEDTVPLPHRQVSRHRREKLLRVFSEQRGRVGRTASDDDTAELRDQGRQSGWLVESPAVRANSAGPREVLHPS